MIAAYIRKSENSMYLTSYGLQCSIGESFLVEETEAHVIVLLLFFLLNLGGSGGRSSSGGSGGRGSCELAGVSQELLEHLSLLEGDLGDGGDGQEVLHAVGNAVRSRSHSGVSNGETHGSDIGDSGHELVLDVQDGGVKHGSLVVHLLDNQTVAEREDLQETEEGGLGGADLVTSGDDGHIVDDLNGTLGNLGGDLQSLEEAGLLGTHAGVLGGDGDIHGGNSSGLSGGGLLVGQKEIPDGGQLLVGEDEADVHLDVGKQLLKFGVLLQLAPDDLPHHGVLAHEDHGLASQGNPDLLHLLGADIVSTHDEAPRVLFQELGELGEVVSFPGRLVLPNHLDVLRKSLRTLL